jgi:hypothetical protein
MGAIGIGVAWLGYSVTLWGYCLLTGCDVKFADLINPVRPYAGNPLKAGQIPADQILPSSGTAGAKGGAGGTATSPTAAGIKAGLSALFGGG